MKEKISMGIATALTVALLAATTFGKVSAYAATDTEKPTLTAVVNNGLLTVDATDDASGIAAIYVNGFEFTDLTNGSLTIRMQQYDTGYQYFTMQAKDGVGNLSDVYRVNNPYYTFPDEDNGEEVEDSLPSDAKPTDPSESTADVTDHVKTDHTGKTTDHRKNRSSSGTSSSSTSSSSSSSKSSSSSVKTSAIQDDEDDYEVDSSTMISDEGREFYTIMTKSGKVFYLVIDRNSEEEKVHFLTDITENDLLNVTQDNKPTLPQNSAVVIKDAGLTAGAGRDGEEPEKPGEETVSDDSLLIDEGETGTDSVSEDAAEEKTGNFFTDNLFLIIVMLITAVGVIAFRLITMKRDEDYVEDEEEGEEDYSDTDEEDGDQDFFDRADDEDEELILESPETEEPKEAEPQEDRSPEDTVTPELEKEPDPVSWNDLYTPSSSPATVNYGTHDDGLYTP